jgi:hypothetical protein
VQLTRADITAAAPELAGERAQELITLLDRNRGGQLHYGTQSCSSVRLIMQGLTQAPGVSRRGSRS